MKRDFLQITDFSAEEIKAIIDLSARLKRETQEGIKHHILKGKTLAMIFQKPSARTRISFETGMWQLGGYALFLGPADVGLGKRESVKDLAHLFSRYNDIIMARVFDHQHILELAEHATVPVINGLSNYNHPCQIMADIFTVFENRGHLEDLKVSFFGEGNNVFHSWLYLAHRIPMKICLACPKGYEPDSKLVKSVRSTSISEVIISNDPYDIVSNSDVIYTDVWASMGEEEEVANRAKIFHPFQVNSRLMRAAGDQAYFLHCLPAHRGDEVTDKVLDSSQSVVFDEAENRMHVQKAIIVTLMGAA